MIIYICQLIYENKFELFLSLIGVKSMLKINFDYQGWAREIFLNSSFNKIEKNSIFFFNFI
jgi:hypothetical protein